MPLHLINIFIKSRHKKESLLPICCNQSDSLPACPVLERKMAENIKESSSHQVRSENVEEEESLPAATSQIDRYESCNLNDSVVKSQITQDLPDVQSIHTLKTMNQSMAAKN